MLKNYVKALNTVGKNVFLNTNNNKKFISTIATTSHNNKIKYFSLNLIHREEKQEQVRGLITPELYTKTRPEIKQLFQTELEKLVTKITQEDGYTPHDLYNFVLGEHTLRLKVFKAAMARFGKEIPNADLPKILTVKDLLEWFIQALEKQRPPATFEIPENVKLFIEKHQGKTARKENEKGSFKKL
ncbi:hypothetical protein ABK040_016855 [Willaertia magna]